MESAVVREIIDVSCARLGQTYAGFHALSTGILDGEPCPQITFHVAEGARARLPGDGREFLVLIGSEKIEARNNDGDVVATWPDLSLRVFSRKDDRIGAGILTKKQSARVESALYRGRPVSTLQTTEELHFFAVHFNWDDAPDRLLEVVRSPLCDRGTALFLFWTGDAFTLLEDHADRKDFGATEASARGYFDVVTEIAERMASGFYTSERFAYTPDYGPERFRHYKRPIPDVLFCPTGGVYGADA